MQLRRSLIKLPWRRALPKFNFCSIVHLSSDEEGFHDDIEPEEPYVRLDGFKLRDYVNEIEFVQDRIKLFEQIYERQQQERSKDTFPIKVTLPDGTVKEAVGNQTSPMDIAIGISKGLAKKAVIAKVNGALWDLPRPLEGDCNLEILKFDSDEGNDVFWHSSSHVLGQSLERLFKGKLTVGPALDKKEQLSNGGFYYDVDTGDVKVSEKDFKEIEKMMKKIAKDKQDFKRIVMTKDEALQMFKENPFKKELINDKIPDGSTCTAYRCGPLVDLCRGPHIPSTGIIKSMKIVKNGANYWKQNSDNPQLQRVYGISFPDNKLMKQYEKNRKKAEESDHRRLGKKYELFFFDEISPGSCFWLPHGTRLYNKLISFIRVEYIKRGYTEVITPNIFDMKLWETSGHAAKYRENMFLFECEGTEFGLKPMNCPGHCCMFKHSRKSYRDLPQRIADFGVLHRNEISGSLTGLTRVRRFQQDDAHIFCRIDQIEDEVEGVLDFLDYVYGVFGFTFEVELSTRPENKLGTDEMWDQAERALANCLTKFCDKHKETIKPWKENPADGAFYGPKIDIKVFDCMGREFQCGTVQLDFQLPQRFELEYATADNKSERPVMIHRAILGSVERFSAILIEHFSGKLPFWCSPRQIIVIPIHEDHLEYAQKVSKIFELEGYYSEVDDSSDRIKKKVRNASNMAHNMILVVGKGEIDSNSVNIRLRNGEKLGVKTLEEAKVFFKDINDKKTMDY